MLATLGWITIEGEIAIKKICYCGNLLRLPALTRERQLLISHIYLHQYGVLRLTNSVTGTIIKYLHAYELMDTVMEILDLGRVFPSKFIWKREVKRKVFKVERQEWTRAIQYNTKLDIFRHIVHDIEPHAWWEFSRENPMFLGCVNTIMKLIFGEHRLNVNSGRMTGVPRNMRLCTMCVQGQVEDLEHFILHCDKYYHTRQSLSMAICAVLPEFSRLSNREQLFIICGGSNENLERARQQQIMKISCVKVSYMYRVRITAAADSHI